MKRFISMFLAITLMVISSQTAFAFSPNHYNTRITTDNESVRIAESFSEGYKFVSTYDKISKIAVIEQIDISNNQVVSSVIVDTKNTPLYKNDIGKLRLFSVTTQENTFSNYEYTKIYGSPNEWELRRPDGSINGTIYFKTKETAKNTSHLSSFKEAVDQINSLEKKAIATIGLQVFTGVIAILLTYTTVGVGASLTAYLASLGFTGSALNYGIDLEYQYKVALDKYWEVYNSSEVYY